ncbi:hypothetical protein GCM10027089_55230 [Nocardia thraciensis]
MLSERAREFATARTIFPSTSAELTLSELDAAASSHARGLIEAGVRPGDIVALLGPTSADLIVSLFGIMRAGAAVTILPVPIGTNKLEVHAEKISRILNVARVDMLVGSDSYAPLLTELTQRCPDLRVVGPSTSGAQGSLPDVDADAPAVVQFTSGSTGSPRGVTLSHRSVVAGVHGIVEGAGLTPDDVLIQWVPLYHDMGLFGLLANLLNGAESHVFEPFDFLRKPGGFLRYLAQHHGTLVTGPSFSYDLLAAAAGPEIDRGLDVSCWRLAFNGAEPISPATVHRFEDVFGPAGIAPSTMYPVYGMAEVTLAVSFPRPGTPPHTLHVDRDSLRPGYDIRLAGRGDAVARELVSVGIPVPGIDVRVTDDSGKPCSDNIFGEIQVRGAAVMSGYLHDEDATRAAFDGPWLRTGDLGFRHDGELYIAGRRKEMAIIQGRNIFPEDIEAVAKQVPGVYRRRCVAAPGTGPDGTEHIAVIVETELPSPAHSSLANEVRRRIAEATDVHAVRIHIVEPRWLTRTSSGKWQRLQAVSRLRTSQTTAAAPTVPTRPQARTDR